MVFIIPAVEHWGINNQLVSWSWSQTDCVSNKGSATMLVRPSWDREDHDGKQIKSISDSFI